jgi:hypothetical protein
MKKLTSITLVFTVLMPLIAATQEAAPPNTGATPKLSAKAITLSGTVADDGQTVIGDKDARWTVANPEALDGRDGSQVTIKCLAYPDKHEVRVLSVRAGRAEIRYSANRSDSAFRR